MSKGWTRARERAPRGSFRGCRDGGGTGPPRTSRAPRTGRRSGLQAVMPGRDRPGRRALSVRSAASGHTLPPDSTAWKSNGSRRLSVKERSCQGPPVPGAPTFSTAVAGVATSPGKNRSSGARALRSSSGGHRATRGTPRPSERKWWESPETWYSQALTREQIRSGASRRVVPTVAMPSSDRVARSRFERAICRRSAPSGREQEGAPRRRCGCLWPWD